MNAYANFTPSFSALKGSKLSSMEQLAGFSPLMHLENSTSMVEVYAIITKMNKHKITLKRIKGEKYVPELNTRVPVWQHFSVPRNIAHIVKAGYNNELSRLSMPSGLADSIGIFDTNI